MTKPLTLWDMRTAWIKAQQLRTIEPVLKEGGDVGAGAFGPSAWPGRTWGSAKVGPGMLDGLAEGLLV
jgi:hypothetical protein